MSYDEHVECWLYVNVCFRCMIEELCILDDGLCTLLCLFKLLILSIDLCSWAGCPFDVVIGLLVASSSPFQGMGT